MAEPDSQISEPIQETEHIEPPAEPVAAEPEPVKRGKGRPAGSRDKVKRTIKPKVRVESIEQPKPPEPEPALAAQPAQPEPEPVAPDTPSPRTLYRETSRHLVHLRGLINTGRRSEVGARYTQKLTQWPVI